jgi:hypothetical protein
MSQFYKKTDVSSIQRIRGSTKRMNLFISREEDSGRALDEYIGPGLQLMEQILDLDGRELKLIVPRSSDAVMDFYIDAGSLSRAFVSAQFQSQEVTFRRATVDSRTSSMLAAILNSIFPRSSSALFFFETGVAIL